MRFNLIFTSILATMFLSSCSGANSPIVPSDPTPKIENGIIADNVSSSDTVDNPYRGVLGAWHVVIDTEKLTAEILPARNAKKIGDIFDSDLSQFLTVTPCANCLQIVGMMIAPDDNIHVDLAMKHPFSNIATRPDLHGFDVRAIIIGNGDCTEESEVTVVKPDGSEEPAFYDHSYVLNADGYTSHYDELVEDERYFIQGESCEANLNPYLRFYESYSMGTFDPNAPTGYNVMPVGSGNYTRTIVFWPYDDGSHQMRFYIVADVAYGQSAVLANRKNPQYYLPAFNRTEPWRMEYWIENNNLSEDTNSSADVVVQVFDWQHNATVDPSYPNPSNLSGIPQSSKVTEVKLVIPLLMSDPIVVTTPEAGTGTPDDPLRYRLKVINENGYIQPYVSGMIAIRDELYGQAAPGGRLPVPESPSGFPYSTLDIRDYAYYGVIPINFPNIQYAGVY